MKKITHTNLLVTYMMRGLARNHIFHEGIFNKLFTKRIILSLLTALLCMSSVLAQNVNIPDANFKAYLVGNTAINTNGDTEIQVSEASAFTGLIDCNFLNISDLTGIEAFTSLTSLSCYSNQLTSLDVSNNTELTFLLCYNNQLTALDVSNNTKLTWLNAGNNQISTFDVSSNSDLEYLYVNTNPITSLDISNNTSLISLICNNNQLSTLDVSNQPNLSVLHCFSNELTSLDVSNNTSLTQLRCYNNQLTSLDVSNNLDLTQLFCQNNELTTLDVSQHASLVDLRCGNNLLTEMDVSQNSSLTNLYCENNQLESLNVANGNNLNFTDFRAQNNPNLTCIQVDDAAYSTTNWTDIDAGADFSEDCSAAWCTIDIPDANFKSYLVGNTSINTNGDGEIQCDEASSFSGSIIVSFQSITDLTGIEAFTALNMLACENNQLTSLNVSQNANLTFLSCGSNQLTSLNVSQNANLTFLSCGSNQLTSLDITQNTALESLDVSFNQFTSLDVSHNTGLTYLRSRNNQLTTLDVSQNTDLIELYCNNNQLTQLNIANGNNTNFVNFYATNNPNLTCIQVDDASYSSSNWPEKDSWASYSEDCTSVLCMIDIPDANFKAYLVGNISINTNGDSEIQCSEAEAFTGTINVANGSISDLTGIEAFINITRLFCSQNQLTALDISQNTALTLLSIRDNQISSLNLSNNVALEEVDLTSNQLTSLDVTNCPALVDLGFDNNQLTSIDLSNNASLAYLFCENNQLTELDVSNNTSLIELFCLGNEITSLDLSQHADLQYFDCNDNQLTELNIANGNNVDIQSFDATNNPNLTCITVDDVAYAEANFTDVDEAANFSTNCNNTANDILTFSFTEQVIDAIIDTENHTVVIDVVSGTDFSNLTPTFTVSAGASVNPASGVAQDFSSAFVYTITAENPTAIQEWTVTVREENTAPSDIALDNNTIDENNDIDAVIGTFSTTDVDASDTHTYSLVVGSGDTDNASFDISGSDLIALESFDFETKSSYSIRVQTDDGRGGTFEKEFTISINDVEDRREQTITFEPIESQFFEAGSVTLSASSSSGLTVSFDIVSGAATVSGNVVTFTDLGTVVVSASQAGDSEFLPAVSVEQTFEVITVTGFEEAASVLLVYPNPASNLITVQTQRENITLSLLNIQGAEIMEVRPNVGNDISQLDNGIYFLRISDAQGVTTHKIIKK
ncbi:T9SS type A sorting domain-containing protein [Fulvivirga lutea]|uniref:T9SS type A sorting domain-containing protein n=1 Tax=Fulvivirga lutea TaxID=2810512 RepID=A0A974WIM5_9BACT|nr:T9SS type A sorting domain-containing protein [Fulvivirga lutea]QSE99254.1 T9SS type A sorting domain-containing protein [Fulvivirga lutea]